MDPNQVMMEGAPNDQIQEDIDEEDEMDGDEDGEAENDDEEDVND